MTLDYFLRLIPEGWFLQHLGRKTPRHGWECSIQKNTGGSLVTKKATTPEEAVKGTLVELVEGIENKRWIWANNITETFKEGDKVVDDASAPNPRVGHIVFQKDEAGRWFQYDDDATIIPVPDTCRLVEDVGEFLWVPLFSHPLRKDLYFFNEEAYVFEDQISALSFLLKERIDYSSIFRRVARVRVKNGVVPLNVSRSAFHVVYLNSLKTEGVKTTNVDIVGVNPQMVKY